MTLAPDGIVELLAEHERAIGRLYQAYAARFPDYRDFWSQLADEEKEHAQWLRRLLVRVKEGLGFVRPDRFDAATVKDSLAQVERMIEEARRPGFSSTDALNTALTLEESLWEAEYFEVFEGTAAEVVQVQYCLADAAKDHRDRIRKMASSVRSVTDADDGD